jgi:hypothetical protein
MPEPVPNCAVDASASSVTNALPVAPDFFVLNPPRSGSTWLFQNLSQHPEVFIPPMKELKYFSSFSNMCDLEWYLSWYQGAAGKRKGDVSPSYAILPDDAIAQVKELAPDLRLVFLFRDPVDRTWSHIKHQFRLKESVFSCSTETSFDQLAPEKIREAVTNTWTLAYSDYLAILRRWVQAFPRDNVYVGFFDQIIDSPDTLLTDICAHLGLSTPDDWSMYPLREPINRGLTHPVPEEYRTFMCGLFGDRTREFAAHVEREYGLALPERWNYVVDAAATVDLRPWAYSDVGISQSTLKDVLARESTQTTHVQLLREDYRGFRIIAYRNDCVAMASSIGHVGILEIGRYDLERLVREGRILRSDTLAGAIGLVDTVVREDSVSVRAMQILDRLVAVESKSVEKDSRIAHLQGAVEQRDAAIADQRQELATAHLQLRDALAAIDASRADAAAQSETLRLLSERIGELRQQVVAAGDAERQQHQREVAHLQARVEELTGDLQRSQAVIDEQRRFMAERLHAVEDAGISLRAAQDSLTDRETELAATVAILREREQELQALQTEMAKRQRSALVRLALRLRSATK